MFFIQYHPRRNCQFLAHSIILGIFGIVTDMKVSFSAVLIGVRDILKSQSFFENVFGVTFDEVRPPFSNFYLNGIEFMIEESSPERSAQWASNYLGAPKGLCFATDNLENFLERVTENGGVITSGPEDKPWGREAVFADPDSNTFIIEQL